jgi:magnesium transporter
VAIKALLTKNATTTAVTPEEIRAAIAGKDPFWLDIDAGPLPDTAPPASHVVDSGSDLTRLLLGDFHFHPLAVEDAEHFGQRPKLDSYDDFMLVVAHGAPQFPSAASTARSTAATTTATTAASTIASTTASTTEVHLFITERYLVSVRRGPCSALDDVRKQIGHHRASDVAPPQIFLTYMIVDALTDSFFPVLSQFDDQIDTLEDAILVKPTEEQLGTIFAMKRQLMAIRKVVTPQRDMFASISSGVYPVPGLTEEGARYFRDLYDHLIRISDLVDSYRDLLSGVMDTHLSTVSNRLNVVMKQLAIIATVFLPLSYLTGFFGQNFATLVRFIMPGWTFWLLGVGVEVVAVILLFVLFQRRGWLGGPSA